MKGFTLLEILLGLGILATAIVAVLGSIHHSLGMQRSAVMATEATLLARQKMEDILAQKELAVGGDRGTFETHPGVTWESQIIEAEVPLFGDRETDLLRLQVRVRWQDPIPREIEATTLIRNRPKAM